MEMPLLLFNRFVRGANVSAVSCDNLVGGRLVADALLDAGHGRLAYIAGKVNTSTNLDREQGFAERLRERGYGAWLREQGDYTYESGFAAGQRLLERPDRPDAASRFNEEKATYTVRGADATGLENQAVWNALTRKGLLRAEYPHQIALTPEGLSYDTGMAEQILHRGGH